MVVRSPVALSMGDSNASPLPIWRSTREAYSRKRRG
jgi:hypothetical protein